MKELTSENVHDVTPNDYSQYRSKDAFRLLITWDGLPETQLDLMLDKKIAKHLISRVKYMYNIITKANAEHLAQCGKELRMFNGDIDDQDTCWYTVSWWPDVNGFPIAYMEFTHKHSFERWFMNKRILTVLEDDAVNDERVIDVDTYEFYMYKAEDRWHLDTDINKWMRRSGYWGSVRAYCKRNDIVIDRLRGLDQTWFEANTAEQLYGLLRFASFQPSWSNRMHTIDRETINPTDEAFIEDMQRRHIYSYNLTNNGSFDTYRYMSKDGEYLLEFIKEWWNE